MKRLILGLVAMVMLQGVASAQIDIFYSTSDTDANAGSSLDLFLGDTGSIYVWVTNDDLDVIDGLGIDMLSSNASILEATAHNISDGGGRWLSSNEGDLGDLVTDSVSIALIGIGGDGIANDGNAVLYSEIVFEATELGTTELSIVENSNAISVSGDAPQSINFGGATVNVSAVPEPSGALVCAGVFLATYLRRRRS